jgi:hypothetical protein
VFFELVLDVSSGVPRLEGVDALAFLVPGVLTVAIVVGLLFGVRALVQARRRRQAAHNQVLLRLRMPRFFAKKDDGTREKDLRGVQEGIAVAETLFAGLSGLPRAKGVMGWWLGHHDTVSFELLAKGNLIQFFIAVPQEWKTYMTQHIHAQFPGAELEDVPDYNPFLPQGITLGSGLRLKEPSLFPIKTYKRLDSDPQNAILNALTKAGDTGSIVIQLLLEPAREEWRKRSVKFVECMQRGATVKEALKGRKPDLKDKEGREIPVRRLSPGEEELVKAVQEKASKGAFHANIRVMTSAPALAQAQELLNNTLNSFAQFNVYDLGNSFQKASVPPKRLVDAFVFRRFRDGESCTLATDELASLWHPPLPTTELANVDWLDARKGAAPANIPKEGLLLGYNTYRGQKTPIYMKHADRQRHMYAIGKSGSGKSEFIANLAIQDIRNGHGVCVVDPHGDLVETLLNNIPPERYNDVIVFSPYDREHPVGLNMLEAPTPEMRDFAVQEMISIFYKLFPPEMIGPMFEHNMRNVMLTLMADPEHPGTIAEIPRMFSDEAYQKRWIAKVKDPVVRAFWENEMAKTSDFHKSEMLGYLISKVGRFVEDEMMRNIIGQAESGFSLREVMDEQKILFMDLSKGKTGEVNAQLLGLIVVTKLQMAALARADMPESQRKDFFLYIDEFQNYITPSIATILSEARKYRLNLIVAHQYMSQVVEKGDTQIKDAILGNVGTMFVSRIGPEDVETFERIFAPTFHGSDMINSDKFTWYVKMIVDNAQVAPFTMQGPPPLPRGDGVLSGKLRQLSRLTYGRPKAVVEADIEERAAIGGGQKAAAPLPPSEGEG